jgi:hypothetical protein
MSQAEGVMHFRTMRMVAVLLGAATLFWARDVAIPVALAACSAFFSGRL